MINIYQAVYDIIINWTDWLGLAFNLSEIKRTMLSDAQWSELEPLVEACRPRGQDAPTGSSAHALDDPPTVSERDQVAGRSRGLRSLVASGADLHPLVAAR